MLTLARLLTVVCAVLGALTYGCLEAAEHIAGTDIWLDQRLLDWKLYALIFCFWLAVFAASRRYLHLDTRP